MFPFQQMIRKIIWLAIFFNNWVVYFQSILLRFLPQWFKSWNTNNRINMYAKQYCVGYIYIHNLVMWSHIYFIYGIILMLSMILCCIYFQRVNVLLVLNINISYRPLFDILILNRNGIYINVNIRLLVNKTPAWLISYVCFNSMKYTQLVHELDRKNKHVYNFVHSLSLLHIKNEIPKLSYECP